MRDHFTPEGLEERSGSGKWKMRIRRASISFGLLLLTLGVASLISADETSQDVGKAPPISEVGWLGMPRSLKQVGVPIAATRATKKKADVASFKTPDLRNVLITGPYFHDGSQETLWDVVDHYNKGDGIHNPLLDQDIQPLALSEKDIDDLVAFMASLTSADYKEQGLKELARQREISRTKRPQRDTTRAFGPKPPLPKLPRDFLAVPGDN